MSQGFINSQNIALPLAVSQGGTGVTTSTGSGNNVLGTSPTIIKPVIQGITSGIDSTAGNLNEILTTGITTGPNLTTNVVANVASLLLSPGFWFCCGWASITNVSGMVRVDVGISQVSATLGGMSAIQQSNTASIVGYCQNIVFPYINISVPATIYVVAASTFSAGTASTQCCIWARRVG